MPGFLHVYACSDRDRDAHGQVVSPKPAVLTDGGAEPPCPEPPSMQATAAPKWTVMQRAVKAPLVRPTRHQSRSAFSTQLRPPDHPSNTASTLPGLQDCTVYDAQTIRYAKSSDDDLFLKAVAALRLHLEIWTAWGPH